MPFRIERVKLDKSAGLFRHALQYAFYDWTREMPTSRRVITYVGIVLQAYAVYANADVGIRVAKGVGYLSSGSTERAGRLCLGGLGLFHWPLHPKWNADFRICSQDTT